MLDDGGLARNGCREAAEWPLAGRQVGGNARL